MNSLTEQVVAMAKEACPDNEVFSRSSTSIIPLGEDEVVILTKHKKFEAIINITGDFVGFSHRERALDSTKRLVERAQQREDKLEHNENTDT